MQERQCTTKNAITLYLTTDIKILMPIVTLKIQRTNTMMVSRG